jgi:hypothetical protein
MTARLKELRSEALKLLHDMQEIADKTERTADDSERGAKLAEALSGVEDQIKQEQALADGLARRAHYEEPATRSAAGIVPTGEFAGPNGQRVVATEQQPQGFDMRALEAVVTDYRKRSGNGGGNVKSDGFD